MESNMAWYATVTKKKKKLKNWGPVAEAPNFA